MSAYLCSTLGHFFSDFVFRYVRESCSLGKELQSDDAVCKEGTAHHCPLFKYLFQSSAKLQGTAEEDTCTSQLHTVVLNYHVSVQGQRRDRLPLSSLRGSGSLGSR